MAVFRAVDIRGRRALRAGAVAVKNSIMDTRGPKRLYLYLRRANRKRVLLLLAVSFFLLVAVCLLGFLFIQDLALRGRVFAGVTVDGTPVGGMSREEATRVVGESVAAPLLAPMVLQREQDEYTLDLKDIDLSIDVNAMVNRAFEVGGSEGMLARMFRRFFNKPICENVPVIMKYDKAKLQSFLNGVADDVNIPARSSSVDMTGGVPKVSSSRYGRAVDQESLMKEIIAALPGHNRRIRIPVQSVRPKVTEEDIGYIIVVKQAEHRLYLYNGGAFVDDFACALGSPQFPTPNGAFTIIKKERNPTWYPPKEEWAKKMSSAPIPPGPGNPLGPYWMEIGDGVGIHAAADETSLGYSVSHGCIRVSEWVAQYLFERVEKGTRVYILP